MAKKTKSSKGNQKKQKGVNSYEDSAAGPKGSICSDGAANTKVYAWRYFFSQTTLSRAADTGGAKDSSYSTLS